MKPTALLTLAALVACSPAQQASIDRAVIAGQTFCAKATATGPLVVALVDAAGAPVIATNQAAGVVQAACASISAIPVSPPPNPGQAPVVAVPITVPKA